MTDLTGAIAEIAAQLETWHVPGVELIAVQDDEVLYAGGVGVRGTDDPELVGARTLFQHGSCGKAYTALLAALLAEDGVLDLGAPVRRYVPELRLADSYVADHITLTDLLSHRSGLGGHDLIWILDSGLDRAELVSRLEFLPMAYEPRSSWSYCNLGFVLAGFAIGRATNSTWEEQLRLRVLAPLGMNRTFVASADVPREDVARPHLLRDDKAVQGEVRRFDGVAPAGQLVSCAEDSAIWLRLHAGADLLSRSAVDRTHAPVALLPAGASPHKELAVEGYGLGWGIGHYRGRKIRWHSGGIDGFSTQTMVLPDERIGILASANLNSTEMPLAAILRLADQLLGESSEESWFDRIRTKPDAAVHLSDETPEPPEAPAVPAPAAHPLEDYVGTYVEPAYGELVVSQADDRLHIRVGASDLDAKHRHYETWDLHYGPLDIDVTVTFHAGADGAVNEAVIPTDPTGRAATRFTRKTEVPA